jgi:hypothetical protein
MEQLKLVPLVGHRCHGIAATDAIILRSSGRSARRPPMPKIGSPRPSLRRQDWSTSPQQPLHGFRGR